MRRSTRCEVSRKVGETIWPDLRLIQEWAGAALDREERELVRRCRQGDQDAGAQLVDAHARLVGTVIWRATADHAVVEDLAQETFLRVFRGLPHFDGRAKLSTWIYTIAHRVAVDHVRSTGRWLERLDEVQHDHAFRASIRGSNPEAQVGRAELDRIVREQLGALPDKYRLPLVYSAVDGLAHDAIGGMLGVNPRTVKTLVFRAKQMLKQRVESVLNQASPEGSRVG